MGAHPCEDGLQGDDEKKAEENTSETSKTEEKI
jgi:hypothetical protein